jgi:Mrp family chromosome partitioning ATPase
VRRLADALAVSEVDRAQLLVAARSELDETLTSPAAARPVQTAAHERSDAPKDEARQISQEKRTNLPHEWGKLIGRERELTQVAALLRRDDVGLVTLTGAGGSGKTRLAIAVAWELVDDFQDGVFLALLAPLTDASAVVPNIAQALGIRDVGERPLLDVLTDLLRRKDLPPGPRQFRARSRRGSGSWQSPSLLRSAESFGYEPRTARAH